MDDERRENDEWTAWWNARLSAMEGVLGESADTVLHAVVPFSAGPGAGGAADVVQFREHVEGVAYATCELIGCDEQVENVQGNYELVICHREDNKWGPNVICRLAHYTCQAELNPGDTLEIGAATPEGSTIEGLLFSDYARFEVRGRPAGLLLCVGVTGDELAACHAGDSERVEQALKDADVYPFTDLERASVLK